MGVGGWILVVIIVLCVAALIIITIKRKQLEKETAVPPRPKKEMEPEPVEELPTDEVLIYGFAGNGRVRNCPFCDGENGFGVSACRICGRDMG